MYKMEILMNKKNEKRKHARAGFTLIEILLVVVIIGMLATIVAVNVPKNLEKARVNKVRADIQGLGVAIQSYYMEEGKYPTSLDQLTAGDDPYLTQAIPKDPWGGTYQYTYPSSHKPFKYDLQTANPDGKVIANWNMDQK